MYKSIISALVLVFSIVGSSYAADRQSIYQEALMETGNLVSILSGAQSNRATRDQAVIVAEAIKQLSFSEAEGRKGDKIALPLGFNQPDLETTLDILDQKAGSIVDIEDVPNDWFTGYLEKAEGEIHAMLKEMDAGDTTSIEKYLSQAQQAYEYLELMVKPPKS
ncbi:hypothetical protein [Curvivirga aplysinae]|uniref:hypothetical protein n=1 Tax=Curvivirga aplysinae TaxID=2529852 RepID=UPI0012BC2786|nr:hypothetical protein [Curvivirga aplysinae]MTI09661.1 hypothetical protein [Curvivirga aplysinae]